MCVSCIQRVNDPMHTLIVFVADASALGLHPFMADDIYTSNNSLFIKVTWVYTVLNYHIL